MSRRRRRRGIRGDRLSAAEKVQVLRCYVFRETRENVERAMEVSRGFPRVWPDPVGLMTDGEWLSRHEFRFMEDGEPCYCGYCE